MVSDEIAIEAKRLSKSFGNQVVLNEIDLEVPPGEAVAIIGANGAGKTTLLRCLSSRVRPSSGAVLWFGESPFGNPPTRRLVGTVSHESCLYPHLTVRENLLFAARMCDVQEPHRRVRELLRATSLDCQADRPAGRISRGTRQRVAILRALVHQPPILLLDEPTCGLDADATDWLVELLKERRDRGSAICFCTHDDRLMDPLADRIFRFHAGGLLEVFAAGSGRFCCV